MKNRNNDGGIVYSTDPHYNPSIDQEDRATLPPEKQKLRLQYERAGRGGKEVTIVRGFVGSEQDLKKLATQLKQAAGCGGAVKDGEIVLQGNKRDRLSTLLKQWGYTQTK